MNACKAAGLMGEIPAAPLGGGRIGKKARGRKPSPGGGERERSRISHIMIVVIAISDSSRRKL